MKTKSNRIVVYSFLFVLLLGALYWKYFPKEKPAPSPVVFVLPTIEEVENYYRLRPDRRFLLAITEIDRFSKNNPVQEPEVTFKNGRWIVRYKQREIGTLPEIPGFLDLMPILISFAKQSGTEKAIPNSSLKEMQAIQSALNEFDGMTALKEVDQIWEKNGANLSLVPWAARALTIMELLTLDDLSVSDSIAARALAMTAISISISKENMAAEQCLLASDFHYFSDAKQLALLLPEEDPVRMFALRNRKALDFAATERKSRSAAYLRLLLDSYQKSADFDRVYEKYFGNLSSLPLMGAAAKVRSFEQSVMLGKSLMYRSLQECPIRNKQYKFEQ